MCNIPATSPLDIPIAPTLAVGAVLVVGNIGALAYGLGALSPSSGFAGLYTFSLSLAIAWWVEVDASRRGLATFMDIGFFALVAWPFVLSWHIVRTRNRLGCGIAALVPAVFAANYATGLVLGWLLRSR